MSFHSAFASAGDAPPIMHVGSVGAARLDICHRQKVSTGARMLLSEIATAVFAHRAYKRTLAQAGACFGRSARQVQRWMEELEAAGLIRRIRRGKKLSNLVLLSRSFFTRLARIVQRAVPKDRPEPGLRARMEGFLRDAWTRRVKGQRPPGVG